jgi:glycosyltransferase involved in cell wall biosynthesis
MKLVAVSRVRNEADIIEAFVRHHAVYFGKLIVLDDGSSDGTYEALQSLRAEGLPLVVLQAPAVGYEQSRYMTRLLRIAVDQFGADWIVPLDADEFIEPEAGKTLADALGGQEEKLFSLAWHNFEWRPEYDDNPELNPVVKQRFRLPPRSDFNKLIVPASIVDETTQLLPGNHHYVRNGEPFAVRPLQSINLGHFPIRSVQQYASKIAIGYLKYLAMPDWDRHLGFHYIEPFKALLTSGLDALKERMLMDSRHYSMTNEMRHNLATVPQDEPLRYQGGALKLALSNSPSLQNILNYAEAITRDRADMSRRIRAGSPEGVSSGVEIASLAVSDDAIGGWNKATAVQFETLRRQLHAVHRELEHLNGDKAILEKRLSRMELELIDARQKLFFQAEQLNSRTFKVVRHFIDHLVRAGLSPRVAFEFLSSLRRK